MEEMTTKGNFAKYVSLSVMGMLGLSCYILADTFFVARGVGATGLTALNLAIPIYSFMNGVGLMIGMGGGTRFALTGNKGVFTQALYYGGLAAVFFLVLGIFGSKFLAVLLGGDGETLDYTVTYLRTILAFSPMFLLNNILLCFVRNDGNPKLSMTAMLVGSGANVVLDYIFIFPFSMGMFGAAFATGLAPIISIMILSVQFIKKKNTVMPMKLKPSLGRFVDISSLGLPALIVEFSSGIVIIVFNGIILSLAGNIGVAAYGIIANIALVVIAIFTGIAQGVQPLLSNAYRHGQSAEVAKLFRKSCVLAVLVASLTYLTVFLFSEPIVSAFNKEGDPVLFAIGVGGIRLYFSGFIFAGINILCANYFSGTDRPRNAFWISFLRGFAVIIPMAFLLSVLFALKGVFLAMTVSEGLVLLISLWLKNKEKQPGSILQKSEN